MYMKLNILLVCGDEFMVVNVHNIFYGASVRFLFLDKLGLVGNTDLVDFSLEHSANEAIHMIENVLAAVSDNEAATCSKDHE